MIRILYVLNGVFGKGGTEAVVLNYFNHIDRTRFHIDFLLHGREDENAGNGTHAYLKEQGSNLYYVTPRGVDFRKNRDELRAFFASHAYDIVHTHMDAAATFVLSAAKKAGIAGRVAHSHNTQHQINKGNPLKNLLYRIVLDRSAKATGKNAVLRVACSAEAGQWLFGSLPFTVLKNGIDSEKYAYNKQVREDVRRALGLADRLVMGHVGRMAYQKNHEYLLQVFARVCKADDRAALLLIGDGELRPDIERRICDLRLSGRVILLGNRTDVPALLQAMDVFVFPSRFEGLSVVLVEAQAGGLPCIVSSEAPRAEITDGLVKYLSIGDDPQCWADEILKHGVGHDRRDTSPEIKRSGYDIGNVVSQLEQLYEGIAVK